MASCGVNDCGWSVKVRVKRIEKIERFIMKFRCNKCDGIMFNIGHAFEGYECTNLTSMFIKNRIRWSNDTIDEEYIATCTKCGKEWRTDNLEGLKSLMQEDGVLL